MTDSSNKAEIAKNAEISASKLTSQLLANPNVLAAFDQKLQTMVGRNSGYIETLPTEVKRRIKALKNIQLGIFNVEASFYEEVHALECKYSHLYKPLFDKRRDIITASYEPTDDECNWKSDEEEDHSDDAKSDEKKAITNGESETDKAVNPILDGKVTDGIPEFWLTIFKNVEMIAMRVQEHDEPILKHLLDIRVQYAPPENMGFTLEFHFSQNEYFTNQVLTKEYKMRNPPDPLNPMSYDGPEIIKCIGCKIDWKASKNVTVKNIKKKLKNKSGPKKMVTKTVKAESFFNFFSPEELDEKKEDADEDAEDDLEQELMADYEIGQLLQTSIIPRAILFFTGEAIEDEDDEDDDEDDDDDENEDKDDENSDEDKDYTPPKNGNEKECKQQ